MNIIVYVYNSSLCSFKATRQDRRDTLHTMDVRRWVRERTAALANGAEISCVALRSVGIGIWARPAAVSMKNRAERRLVRTQNKREFSCSYVVRQLRDLSPYITCH